MDKNAKHVPILIVLAVPTTLAQNALITNFYFKINAIHVEPASLNAVLLIIIKMQLEPLNVKIIIKFMDQYALLSVIVEDTMNLANALIAN